MDVREAGSWCHRGYGLKYPKGPSFLVVMDFRSSLGDVLIDYCRTGSPSNSSRRRVETVQSPYRISCFQDSFRDLMRSSSVTESAL